MRKPHLEGGKVRVKRKNLQKKLRPADTSLLVQQDPFRTVDLQNCKIMILCGA